MKKFTQFIIISSVILFASCGGSKPTTSSKSENSKPTENVSKKGDQVVKVARTYIGTKYKYGGITKKGIDCSGLAYNVYKEMGITLPRTSTAQSGVGKRVYIGEVVKGDLIFFAATPGSKKITHVGIVSYSNDGYVKMIHASSSKGVREDAVDQHYWKQRYIRASRPLVQ